MCIKVYNVFLQTGTYILPVRYRYDTDAMACVGVSVHAFVPSKPDLPFECEAPALKRFRVMQNA